MKTKTEKKPKPKCLAFKKGGRSTVGSKAATMHASQVSAYGLGQKGGKKGSNPKKGIIRGRNRKAFHRAMGTVRRGESGPGGSLQCNGAQTSCRCKKASEKNKAKRGLATLQLKSGCLSRGFLGHRRRVRKGRLSKSAFAR